VAKRSPRMWDTEETLTRKVAVTRIYGVGDIANEIVVGWECTPPQKRARYTIHVGRGRIFRTSPVEGITETVDGISIKTVNSLYEIKYLS